MMATSYYDIDGDIQTAECEKCGEERWVEIIEGIDTVFAKCYVCDLLFRRFDK